MGSLPIPLGSALRWVTRKSAGEQLAMFIVKQSEGWEREAANSSGQRVKAVGLGRPGKCVAERMGARQQNTGLVLTPELRVRLKGQGWYSL